MVPMRSCQPGMVLNPLFESCSQSVGVSGEVAVGAVLLLPVGGEAGLMLVT
jgi:hypothetical protein